MRRGAALITLFTVAACGPKPLGPAGGPLAGPPDLHCDLPDGGILVQPTSMAVCDEVPTGGYFDGGLPVIGGGNNYGPTRYNTTAYEDNCKYVTAYACTPLRENEPSTFTVKLTGIDDGQPITGAQAFAEVFLNVTHPSPNSGQQAVESPPGTYTMGPVIFDEPGQWTVRFHFFELCTGYAPNSPHGHTAFYVEVP